jgi:sugar lactone lactonase YvrE
VVWTHAGVRITDGASAPAGRFTCVTMAYDPRPGAGTLYRLDPDGAVIVVLSDVTISNGLGFAPDGSHAYYVDTPTRRIDRFDYDTANGLTGRRPFVELPEGVGFPDGVAVDEQGGVWVALYDGGAVRRYTAHGELDAVVEVGAQKVTACTFGGADLADLFITTSRENLPPGADPAAGALFRVQPGVRGVPVREFAG